MRQIDDSWKINPNNPKNEFGVLGNIHSKNILKSYDNQELNNYRKGLIKDLINKKCSTVCLNSKDINFIKCFDNCEVKFQGADNIYEFSKREYNNFKLNHSFK